MVYGNAMIHAVCNGAAKQGDDGCEPNQGKKLNHKSFWFDKTVRSFRIFRPSVFWHFAKNSKSIARATIVKPRNTPKGMGITSFCRMAIHSSSPCQSYFMFDVYIIVNLVGSVNGTILFQRISPFIHTLWI